MSKPPRYRVLPRTDIDIPHLAYTVRVRRINNPHDPDSTSKHDAFVRFNGKHGTTMYLARDAQPMLVAHEVVHILQHLCEVRDMTFELESEHMAYLMQYIMGRTFGYKWVTV